MRIMIQNRCMVIETPRNIWIQRDEVTGSGVVMCSNRRAPVLGIYSDMSRAQQVLGTLFEFQRNAKRTYLMPNE